MFVKGILLGVGVALVVIVLFLRWKISQIPPTTGGVSIDVRSAVAFFGGMGIGIGFVSTSLLLGFYALKHYALR